MLRHCDLNCLPICIWSLLIFNGWERRPFDYIVWWTLISESHFKRDRSTDRIEVVIRACHEVKVQNSYKAITWVSYCNGLVRLTYWYSVVRKTRGSSCIWEKPWKIIVDTEAIWKNAYHREWNNFFRGSPVFKCKRLCISRSKKAKCFASTNIREDYQLV